MTQYEVLHFLKLNSNSWWTSKDICIKLNLSIGSATTNLQKLRKANLVLSKEGSRVHSFQYKYKNPK